MSDVIIAIVPAPGHEGLVAGGPMGERPALLYGVIGGDWFPPGRLNEHRIPDGRRALVLEARGGPRLGMVRLREALNCSDSQVIRYALQRRAEDPTWPASDITSVDGWFEHAAARLAVQRGLASEVLVLPVTP